MPSAAGIAAAGALLLLGALVGLVKWGSDIQLASDAFSTPFASGHAHNSEQHAGLLGSLNTGLDARTPALFSLTTCTTLVAHLTLPSGQMHRMHARSPASFTQLSREAAILTSFTMTYRVWQLRRLLQHRSGRVRSAKRQRLRRPQLALFATS